MSAHGQLAKQLGTCLATASDAVVSVFYPAGWRLCERLLTRATRVPICDQCMASLAALPLEVCEICGSPLAALFSAPVSDCGAPESASPDAEHTSLSGCIACQGERAVGKLVRDSARRGR
jgi:hypothetical protein